MSDASSNVPPLVTLLAEAGLAALYLSSLVFLAGWSYAERYFAELGLNLSAVDGLEVTSVYAFALWVFRDAWLALGAAVVLALVCVYFLMRRLPLLAGAWAPPTILLAACLSLLGAGWLGAARASAQVETLFVSGYQNFVRVKVIAKSESALETILSANSAFSVNGCLRKIYMDRRNLYAYPGFEGPRNGRPEILVMPLSEIALVQTLTIPDLCPP